MIRDRVNEIASAMFQTGRLQSLWPLPRRNGLFVMYTAPGGSLELVNVLSISSVLPVNSALNLKSLVL